MALSCIISKVGSTSSARLQSQPRRDVRVTAIPRNVNQALAGSLATLLVAMTPMQASAEVRLPPLDTDPQRCERGYTGNTIGQSNGVSGDKVLDLRFCDYTGADLAGKSLTGALLNEAVLKGANLREAVISKAFLVKADLQNADLSNSVLDRSAFDNADLRGASFVNAVITGITGFETANLEGANFEDALIGNEDAKRLCKNPQVAASDEMKMQIGCRGQ